MFRFDTQDGLYDVAWSEINENQLVSARSVAPLTHLLQIVLTINDNSVETDLSHSGTSLSM